MLRIAFYLWSQSMKRSMFFFKRHFGCQQDNNAIELRGDWMFAQIKSYLLPFWQSRAAVGVRLLIAKKHNLTEEIVAAVCINWVQLKKILLKGSLKLVRNQILLFSMYLQAWYLKLKCGSNLKEGGRLPRVWSCEKAETFHTRKLESEIALQLMRITRM